MTSQNRKRLEQAAFVLIKLAECVDEDGHPCPGRHFSYMDYAATDEHGHLIPGGAPNSAGRDDLWAMARLCQLALHGTLDDHATVNDGRLWNDGEPTTEDRP